MVRVARAFVSLCQLEFTPDSLDDKRYEKYQLSLVCILTTLCTTARNDFLIYDAKLNTICLWQNGMELMRNCYCNRKIRVDRNALLELRDAFFTRYRWFYDSSRQISRNHQNPGNYDVKYQKANHLEESMKWKLSVGNEDYSMPVVTTSSSSPSVVTDDQLSKKARAGKAAKARLLNLAELNCGSEVTTKKAKPPKLAAAAAGSALSVRIDKMPHIPVPSTTPTVLNRAKTSAVPLVRNDAMISCSSTSIPKSTFEDVQEVIRDGDVIEERIKQEARIKIAAAREQAKIDMEVARQKAEVQAEAIKLEAQRVIGLQIVAKEQAVLNARNEGTS
jgi:hypothetical protein